MLVAQSEKVRVAPWALIAAVVLAVPSEAVVAAMVEAETTSLWEVPTAMAVEPEVLVGAVSASGEAVKAMTEVARASQAVLIAEMAGAAFAICAAAWADRE